jgi:hypothetical protein
MKHSQCSELGHSVTMAVLLPSSSPPRAIARLMLVELEEARLGNPMLKLPGGLTVPALKKTLDTSESPGTGALAERKQMRGNITFTWESD